MRDTAHSSPWARWGPDILVGVVCAVILIVAAFYRGHSVESMDVRTYAQMTRGVAEHGLPYWDNGPLERFPALVVPWGIEQGGHLWGVYGPLYPYLLAPAFRLGGLPLVSACTWAMLAPLVLVTYALAKKLVRDRWLAAVAGVSAVACTPIPAKALETTAFPLTAVMATLGTYLAVRFLERPSRGMGMAIGLVWAAAGATHALCYPMALAMLAFLASFPLPGARSTIPAMLRAALLRGWPIVFGFLVGILPSAVLNRVRFGSYNPISYGPLPWTGLLNPELFKMNLGDQLRFSAPAIAFLGLVAAAILAVRRRRAWVLAVLVASAGIAFATPLLQQRFARYAEVALGYFVDVSLIELEPPYQRWPDGLGYLFGGWAVKTVLQCSPILILSPLAWMGAKERRWAVAALLVPAAALFASLVMRANLGNVDAFGWPWLYMRYTFAALPLLVVASFVVIERLRPGRGALMVASAIAFGLGVYFARSDDTSRTARVILLLLPLALAAATLVLVVRWHRRGGSPRAAIFALACVGGTAAAICVGHDLRVNADLKVRDGAFIDRLTRTVPHRFALVGVLGQFDGVLATTVSHDVQYADLLRLADYRDLRPLLDHWREEDRPIYFWLDGEPYSPWSDVSFREVMPGLHALTFEAGAGER